MVWLTSRVPWYVKLFPEYPIILIIVIEPGFAKENLVPSPHGFPLYELLSSVVNSYGLSFLNQPVVLVQFALVSVTPLKSGPPEEELPDELEEPAELLQPTNAANAAKDNKTKSVFFMTNSLVIKLSSIIYIYILSTLPPGFWPFNSFRFIDISRSLCYNHLI